MYSALMRIVQREEIGHKSEGCVQEQFRTDTVEHAMARLWPSPISQTKLANRGSVPEAM